jgi:hypothetical protein
MRVLSLTALTVVTLGLISAPTLIFAQEPPPSQFEHIQGLEPFVGIWRAGKQGEGEVPMILSCRLTTNRSYLRLQVSTPTDNGPQTMGTMLIGRDFAKNQVSVWGFWGDNQAHGKVKVGEGTASWRETGVRNDGTKSTANVSIRVDGDKLTFDLTDIKYGDDAPPDMHFTFTRSQQRFGRRGGQ